MGAYDGVVGRNVGREDGLAEGRNVGFSEGLTVVALKVDERSSSRRAKRNIYHTDNEDIINEVSLSLKNC